MNTNTDLDRLLTEWLDEGPKRAPDRPVQLAVEHARSHPRRPDPFGFMRSDVMSGRRLPLALQPAWMLLLLGLLLVAMAAVIAVGSGLVDQAVVVPRPTTTPSVAPSASASVSSEPTAAAFSVDLVDGVGNHKTVAITDASGLLVGAASGQPEAGASGGDGIVVRNEPGSPTTLRLTWVGCPDDPGYELTIDAAARDMVLERDPCSGDTLPLDHILLLTFSQPVPAGEVQAVLEERTTPTP